MKFGFAKKKTADAQSPAQAGAPLSVLWYGEGDFCALASALPAGTQVIPVQCEPPCGTEGVTISAPGSAPCGKYVVPVRAEIAGDAAEFFSALAEREEDLVLFARPRGERGEADAEITARILRREKELSAFGAAVSPDLYRRISPLMEEFSDVIYLPAAFLLAQSAVSLAYAPFAAEKRKTDTDAETVRRLVRFFAAVKGELDPPRYRYLFNEICARIVAAYARLAAQKDKNGAAELDEFLKAENMALRVAADERAPLNFIRALRKRGFEPSLFARAGAAAALLRSRGI